MYYFVDFDRTVFDTPSFKKAFARRARAGELFRQAWAVVKAAFDPNRAVPLRRIATTAFGTFASHGRFGFTPGELKQYLYPDAVSFLKAHAADITIITYGVKSFIAAKVTDALTDVPLRDIIYTHKKKGRVLRQYLQSTTERVTFIDDAVFQLESVARHCPEVSCIEIRRDDATGDGRWPVIRDFKELEALRT